MSSAARWAERARDGWGGIGQAVEARPARDLVARAKITSRPKLTAYADAGAGILEVSRRGVRAQVRELERLWLQELPSDTVGGSLVLAANTYRNDPGRPKGEPCRYPEGGRQVCPRLPWDRPTKVRGARRGLISRFTAASRRRFVFRLSNWHGADRWVTLTTHDNIRRSPISSRMLGRFLTWCRSRGTLSYVWVRERQQRGAIHYHVWTRGLTASEVDIRDAWLRAADELGDPDSRNHAVQVIPWTGPVWYAVAESTKRFQKQAPPVHTFGTAGRFWSCSHDVARSRIYAPLGIDGVRWFRRWLRRVSHEYRKTVRRCVFHAKRESLMLRGEWTKDTRRRAWLDACAIAKRGRKWLQRFQTGYLMLDRLPGIEDRLPAALEPILTGDRGRGLAFSLT